MQQPARVPVSYAGVWDVAHAYEPGDLVTVPYSPPLSFVAGNPHFLCLKAATPGGGAPGNPEFGTFQGRPVPAPKPLGEWVRMGAGAQGGESRHELPWRGDWQNNRAYERGDLVGSEGSAYFASRHIDAGKDRPGRWVRDDPWEVVVRTRFPVFHASWNTTTVYNAWDIVQHRLKWWSLIDSTNPVIGLEPGAESNTAWQVILELPDPSKWRPNEIASLTTSIAGIALSATGLGLTGAKFGLELRKLQTEVGRGLAANVRTALNEALQGNNDLQALEGLNQLRNVANEARAAANQATAARNVILDALTAALARFPH